MQKLDFNELVGKTVSFLGSNDCIFYVKKRSSKEVLVFEVMEDNNDDYASSLSGIDKLPSVNYVGNGKALSTVKIETNKEGDFVGYTLTDKKGHCWLKFGTNNSDSYYPIFVFDYSPPTKLI